jgi:hypothetical protein
MNLEHYVYTHTRLSNGEVFYVGKGCKNRLLKKNSRNSYWRNIVKKENGFNAQIVAGGLTEVEAFKFETLLIRQIKAQTRLNLANLNDGGIGGVNPSKETLEKMKLSNKGRVHSEAFRKMRREMMLGHVMTDDNKKKISDAIKGVPKSKEHVEKVRKALIGKKHTTEAKQKMSASMKGRTPPNKGKTWSEETRAKIAAIWAKRRENGTSTRVFSDSHKAAMKAAWEIRKQGKNNDLS